jgi:hypothetical protein
MAAEPVPNPPVEALPTVDEAIANAARLLRNAELETNLAVMERLERLADSWNAIAHTLLASQRND